MSGNSEYYLSRPQVETAIDRVNEHVISCLPQLANLSPVPGSMEISKDQLERMIREYGSNVIQLLYDNLEQ